MAPAREEKQKQAYEGLGAGGKFRKAPFRRTTHSTPYDRPPTTLRNPSAANDGDGWLSKLVDPAQRLISSSAHRLFSSVFSKRLPPPPPPPSPPPSPQSTSTGVDHEAKNKGTEVSMDPPEVQKAAVDQSVRRSTTADGGVFTELEQILEQKTFTRSEIDRLTSLLHSRTVDIPTEDQENKSEVMPSEPAASRDRKHEYPKTPVQEKKGFGSVIASHPFVSTTVFDEDVASPAQLAKAYMGSRASKVSPSILGLRGQSQHEVSPILSSLPFTSKSPMMSLVPRTSGNGGAPENGFATPRARGRSAIYSMARTPYSRVGTTSTFKGAGSTVDGWSGASSCQSVWPQSQPSAKQGALKRRFSVLDNDIGSAGPIRKIRQKPNLISSRGLGPPILGTRMSSEAAQSPSSVILKPLSLGEPKHKGSSENGGNAVPSTSFSMVPSKSSEMGLKILEHIRNMASPTEKAPGPNLRIVRDKSPTKLSPSMLRGQALKSIEDVDSSNFFDDVHNNKSSSKLEVSFDHLIPEARDFTTKNREMVKENGPLRIGAPIDSSVILINGADFKTKKESMPNVKTAVSAPSKSGFKMSAHEDFLDLDDDDKFIGVASDPLADGRGKAEISYTEKSSVSTANVKLEKPPVLSHSSTNSIFPSVSSSSMMVLSTGVATLPALTSDKVAPPKESHAGSPMLNSGVNVTSTKNSDMGSPVFTFSAKTVEQVAQPECTFASSPAVATSVDVNVGAFSHPKPESSSSASLVIAGATISLPKPLDSDKADLRSNPNAGVAFTVSSAVSPAPSTEGIFSFSTPSSNSNTKSGSSPLLTPATPSVFNNLTTPNPLSSMPFTAKTNSVKSIATETAVTSNSNNISSSDPAPSNTVAPISEVAFSTASTVVTSVPVNSSLESFGWKNKEDRGFGNPSGTSLAGISATSASTGSSITGLSGTTTSIPNQSGVSPFAAGSQSAPISHTSSAGSGILSFGQRPLTESGSSASSLSFGLAGNTAFSSGSSYTALGSSISSVESKSISSTTASSLYSFQSAPPSLGSTFNLTGFSRGASSAAPATNSTNNQVIGGYSAASSTTNSAPIVFGASSSATSTTNSASFVFGGSSAATSTTNSAPFVFGGSSAASSTTNSMPFAFGGSSAATSTTNSAPFVFGGSSTAAANSLCGTSSTAATNSVFGASIFSTSTNNASLLFGSSNVASSTSTFAFTSPATNGVTSQPAFGNPNPAFSSTFSGSNDQMNMEDSMAEDTNQAPTTPNTPPVFGQQPVFSQQPVFGQLPVPTPQSSFVFGSTPTAPPANPFQFSSQQNPANPQNPSFQGSGSLGGVSQGDSFSLGTGGDKSNRRIVRVKHNRPRKK